MRSLAPLPDFDCYAELGVEPWADTASIDAAWRAGMLAAHPDRAGEGPGAAFATARASRLNVAHDWLIDADLRARYDQTRWPRGPRPAIPDIDPLGAWPARQRPPRPPASVAPAIALIAFMGLLAAVVMGPGESLAVGALAVFCGLLLTFYAAWTIASLRRSR